MDADESMQTRMKDQRNKRSKYLENIDAIKGDEASSQVSYVASIDEPTSILSYDSNLHSSNLEKGTGLP
jgi:hypothetical protein